MHKNHIWVNVNLYTGKYSEYLESCTYDHGKIGLTLVNLTVTVNSSRLLFKLGLCKTVFS